MLKGLSTPTAHFNMEWMPANRLQLNISDCLLWFFPLNSISIETAVSSSDNFRRLLNQVDLSEFVSLQ